MKQRESNISQNKNLITHITLLCMFFACVFINRCMKLSDESIDFYITIIGTAVLLAILIIVKKLQILFSRKTISLLLLIEYVCFLTFEMISSYDNFVKFAALLISVFTIYNYILDIDDIDSMDYSTRKTVVIVLTILSSLISYSNKFENLWVCFTIIKITGVISAFYYVSRLYRNHKNHIREINKLKSTIYSIEESNEKLVDYQEKIKVINEQINYQKIDLTRAYNELEQVNTEIKSQTEVMKYMTSSFDVNKCLNMVIEAVCSVKKPKLCAIFIDKDVYLNESGNCVVKTNYSVMQRRLKKDIEKIYAEFSSVPENNIVYKGDQLQRFRFIGDTNMLSMAFIKMVDGKKSYGMMIVTSDEENFFDKGIHYYENLIIELGVSIKNTRLYLKMQDMARKDGLTNIYNRVYFGELFQKTIKTALSKKIPVSVALFDIDKFKSVNDTYGHLAGDEVIKMVAKAGDETAKKYDGFACRYGGEEFLVVLPDRNTSEALEILEELHNRIKTTTVKFADNNIDVNVCIGLSSYPETCTDPNVLISRADNAMYYGKKNGRGRLVVDNPQIDESDV